MCPKISGILLLIAVLAGCSQSHNAEKLQKLLELQLMDSGMPEPVADASEPESCMDSRIGTVCSTGVGGCAKEDWWTCKDGEVECPARPRPPREEKCLNEVDDDCDGEVDETPDGKCCLDSDCGRLTCVFETRTHPETESIVSRDELGGVCVDLGLNTGGVTDTGGIINFDGGFMATGGAIDGGIGAGGAVETGGVAETGGVMETGGVAETGGVSETDGGDKIFGLQLTSNATCVLVGDDGELRCAGRVGAATQIMGPVEGVVALTEASGPGWPGHACGRTSSASIYCYGTNDFHVLGADDKYSVEPQTFRLPDGDAVSVAVGSSAACAVSHTGEVWCWGDNLHSIFGASSVELGGDYYSAQPIKVGVSDAIEVEMVDVGFGSACALANDGKVWCWGAWGGSILAPQTVKIASSVLTNASQISLGHQAGCAVLDTNEVACWGVDHRDGVPGQGITALTLAELGSDNAKVAVGTYAACALKKSGEVWCWGKEHFQLAEAADRVTPQLLEYDGGVISDAVDLAAGSAHACALLQSGEIKCWGDNTFGQLGDGRPWPLDKPGEYGFYDVIGL